MFQANTAAGGFQLATDQGFQTEVWVIPPESHRGASHWLRRRRRRFADILRGRH